MPIETLLTFNRLKQLSNDIKVVTEAIKTSDKLLVALERTVHLRGFPTSATLDDLLEGLKPYGSSRQ